jgi:hypothetical protein
MILTTGKTQTVAMTATTTATQNPILLLLPLIASRHYANTKLGS